MKYRNLFDCLEDAEGRDMEKITKNTPELDEAQFERILSMSERKYNKKKREKINSEYTDSFGREEVAEGVETYDNRPVWIRYAATAAALVLTAGILALTHNILGRHNQTPDKPAPPIIAATSSVTTTGTTDADNTELTTVSADPDATVTGSETTDITTTTTVSSAASSQTPQLTTVAATEAAGTENKDNAEQMSEYKRIATDLFDSYAYCRDYIFGSGLKTSSETVTFRFDFFDWENNDYDPENNHYYISPIARFHKVADPQFPDLDSIRAYIDNIFVLPLETEWCFAEDIGGREISSSEYPDNAIISSESFGKTGHFMIYDGELYASDARFGGGDTVFTSEPEIVKESDTRFRAYRNYYMGLNPSYPDTFELVIARDPGGDRWRIVDADMCLSAR